MKAAALSLTAGMLCSLVSSVAAATFYVNVNNLQPAHPYSNWSSAATNIQDAVDAAADGDRILVTDGTYDTGGRLNGISNRVVVAKAVVVQSVNGPEVTIIRGQGPAGDSAVRCAYLAGGAVFSGFTLTNGFTQSASGQEKSYGGGIWCTPTAGSAIISNCVITGNQALGLGGGVYYGALYHCTIISNSALYAGGGANGSSLNDCTLIGNSADDPLGQGIGGGAASSALTNCSLIGNSASQDGGGAYSGTLSNCTLIGNQAERFGGGAAQSTVIHCAFRGNTAFLGGGAYSAVASVSTFTNNTARYGGGAYMTTLNSCVLTGNAATSSGGGASGGTINNCALAANSANEGGGAYYSTLNNCTLTGNSADYAAGASGSTLNNCITYYNEAPTAPNTDSDHPYGSVLNACCTTPQPGAGIDNFTNAPLFLDATNGDWHLQPGSPCINSGRNSFARGTNDLDGNPRVRGGTVDVGAYEFQNPASVISYAWLRSFGLPADGSADYVDTDQDRVSNWQEWLAGTDPTNATSLLRLQTPTTDAPGFLLRWSSDTNHSYFIQRADRLRRVALFRTLQANIPGLAESTTYTDRDAPAKNAFYRIGTGATNGAFSPVLQQPIPVPPSVTLTWSSVTNRTYSVERATGQSAQPLFQNLKTNLPGLAGTTTFTDTNLPAAGPVYYRVGVQR